MLLSGSRTGKILALMLYEPSWQYYVKYKRFLTELNHPFLQHIDFRVDESMSISEKELCQYRAVAFFYHDPLKQLYPRVYEYARMIESICNKNGITLINRPDALSCSVKSTQLNLLEKGGFNVARAYPFQDWEELFGNDQIRYPIFIRYDCGHDSLGIGFSEPMFSREELLASSLWKENLWERREHLSGLTAVEWKDARSGDGLFRKYRVFVFGETVLSGPFQISNHWFVHGNNTLKEECFQEEERRFLFGECSPEEKRSFLDINRTLNLDFSAIDYSFDRNGEMVIWEANPHPSLGEWAEHEPFKTKFTNHLSSFYSSCIS